VTVLHRLARFGALSDRSTFTSTNARATDFGYCVFVFGGFVVVRVRVGVCKSSSSLSPLSFHGIRAWYRLRAEQQAQEAKEAVRQQEVVISSPLVFATTPVSELFGRHRQTTSDRGAVALREAPANDIRSWVIAIWSSHFATFGRACKFELAIRACCEVLGVVVVGVVVGRRAGLVFGFCGTGSVQGGSPI
jgi:hypothetical protein